MAFSRAYTPARRGGTLPCDETSTLFHQQELLRFMGWGMHLYAPSKVETVSKTEGPPPPAPSPTAQMQPQVRSSALEQAQAGEGDL